MNKLATRQLSNSLHMKICIILWRAHGKDPIAGRGCIIRAEDITTSES